MVDKRKRGGSDSAASVHSASEASEDERTTKETSAPEEAVTNKAMVPFVDGAELHLALQTPSADMLRLLLTRLRNQTNLSFAENIQRSTIPASDKRIQLVKDYCQLCETQASNSGAPTAAAASIFSTWELADRQDLPTLLHLPIFCLAQSLALLSIHYPTHTLGSNIIERILSPNEPWLAMLHNYISNLGGAKFASSKQRDSRSSKGSDVAALASLILLREVSSFAKGRYAVKLFDSFNWSMKVLPHIFNMRRRTNRKSKAAKKTSVALDVSLRRPDIRTLYILFLLSFLQQSYSNTLKLRLLDLGRDFLPAMLKGLPQDPPDVVQTILLHLHEDLVKDQRIPRSKKVEFWNEWACGCVVQLYPREEEHVLIHADTDAVENPSVAELAHHFLLSICTNPGFGICYPDRGWYPRKASVRGDTDEAAGTSKADGAVNGLDKDSFSFEMGSTQKAKSTSISTGGSIYNKVLSGVLRQLAVAEDLRQQELALSILTACPELVGPYLESSCAGLSVDPRPSSRWLCNVAFFGRVAGLELPSFRNAKVEHLESEDTTTSSALIPLSHRLVASEPPPINTVLANLLPGPLHRFLFSQGLTSTDKLVRHSTCALLCRCLDRMVRYRDICLGATDELDEDEHGPWRRHLELLETEARRRIPDISIVIQILQVATSRPQTSAAADSSTVANESSDGAEGTNENTNMLSTEVALRLLSLYYQAVPSSAFDVRFNAGKLLTNSFIQASAASPENAADDMDTGDVANEVENAEASDSDAEDDEEDTNEINLGALCQVHTLRILSHAARAASFDWTAKPTGTTGTGNLSYLGMLLTLYISTPLEQVKTACEQLLESLLAPSSFFEHDLAEIDAWLSGLPQADTRVSSQADDESGSKPSAVPAQQHISSEQQTVIAFLDECMLRCAKTPYRYIEASRQFLRDNGRQDEQDDESEVTSGADLLASPWLMALLEQFCIRIDKGLFDDAESVEGLTAFFARLLPTLCAYARHTSAFEAMASKINSHVSSNDKYASSQFTAAVGVSNARAIRVAPEPAFEPGSKSKGSVEIASTTFADCTDPRDLKTRLRSVKRPLTQSQLSSLYAAVQGLQASGYALASQILGELDPVAENLATALFGPEVVFGAIPVLHLPLNARFVQPAHDDFMATTSEEEVLDQTTLVPWRANGHARLALWTAVSRGQGMQDERHLLPHASSLIAAADASEYLTHEEARQFLFVDSVALLNRAASPHVSKSLLRRISELAIKYLDPRHKDQAQIVRATLNKVDGNSKAVDVDYLRCMANLTPFMDEADAVELLSKALEVLREAMRTQDSATGQAEAEVWIAAAESLAAIASSAGPISRVWTALAMKLQLIVDAVCSTEGLHAECRTLLLGIIQATLQSEVVLADSAVEKQLAMLQLGGLINGAAHSRATDGALVAALHVHPKTTLPILDSVLSVLSSGVSADARSTVQALPCTLLAILTALSEAESVTNDGGAMLGDVTWEHKHIGVIVDVCIDFVLSDPELIEEAEVETVERHAACLVAALRCAARYGWNEPQSAASGRLAKFAKDAVENKPYVAFRAPLIQVLLGLVEDVPELPSLSEVVQASINAALLWLVRRFAEDSNDSARLVHTISLFTDLVERASASESVRIHLRASLVDPVVQAAIKNRMRALDQMRLVRALCVHAELDNSHLSRYLGALSAHSDLASVMRGSANLLAPLRYDTDEQENGQAEADNEEAAEDEKVQRAQELKLVVVELVHLIAGRDAKGLIRAPLLTRLLPFYGASLSRADRMLLSLFRKFEEASEQSFATLMQEWTLPASQQGGGGGHAHSALEALQSLDANVVFATCTEFPRLLSLANTVASGYKTDGSAEADVVLPGQVYGRHTDAAQRYDPVFLASLLARVTAPDEKLTGLQWLAVFATNVPGLAVCGLSSCCPDMRRASLTLISSLYLAVREADFQEKDHLIMVLDLLRDALDSTQAVQESSTDAPFLPTTTTLFIAHSLRSVTTPASFVYPVISHFLLQRSELDVGDVPLLYNLLYTASDRVKQERMWMLRLLRDVARSGGRSDWKILKRRRTWELLASLYDACDARGAGASAERAVEEAAMRALVEDTTFWLVANADVAIELVTRRGLLAWMWQQIVREGVVALADPALSEDAETVGVDSLPPTSAPRSVWMLLLAQLMRSVDVDRLDRATQGAWIAPVLSLVHTTTAALQNCDTAPAGGHLPNASDELVRTITCAAAEVIDRLVPHAQEHARLHATALLATLETLVKLGAKALHSAGTERTHVERACVRVNSALLTIAPALTDAALTRRLAVILRQSTALCMRFDAQIHALVTSNLFPPASVS